LNYFVKQRKEEIRPFKTPQERKE